MPETPQEVLKMIQDNNIKIIDLKFIDMPGIWQHCSFYYDQIDESSFSDGVAFDGSSIRNGIAAILALLLRKRSIILAVPV